ncbi:amidase signature domain-containing protein [Triangularia setosa]|uniref:Amidase signature domain-containing protein n=1 Tax=Triangularia setosa TaxID=2587417 RepID=A0AAN7A9I0_9PEZI|nr:amidase signature domain-containing protein [Podospora setosa]
MTTESWETRAAAKRENITCPFIEQFLDNEEIRITSHDAVEVVDLVQLGKLTAVQVTTAFSKRAAITHQIMPSPRTAGPPCPLHGLPVSLKDQFHFKGVDTSMGYVGKTYGFPDSQTRNLESQPTTDLLSLGAVLCCKTTLPQTLFCGETINHITGTTVNPNNQLLSCGGSTGGEGTLIALGGSVLGLGTDIGAFLRIPAAFNGIYSIKPTVERVSSKDVATTNPGQTLHPRPLPPLKSTLSTQPWLRDPDVVPIPFREDIFQSYKSLNRPLKFGIVWSDGIVNPHPPIRRGLEHIVTSLLSLDLRLRLLLEDASADARKQLALSGEPLLPGILAVEEGTEPVGLLKHQDLTLHGKAYENAYSDYWNGMGGVDAVIMPVAPSAAVRQGKYYHIARTEIVSLLNYSAVVVPAHGVKVNKGVDILDKDAWWLTIGTDDPEIYHGALMGVQIVGRKFEEKVLGIAGVADEVLKAYAK